MATQDYSRVGSSIRLSSLDTHYTPIALATLAGLHCYRVVGHGKGFGYSGLDPTSPIPSFEMNHAWNCVLMDETWHLIDSCWGSGQLDGSGTYQNRFDPSWFSSTPTEFAKRHYPEDPAYQLIPEEPMSWESYMRDPTGPHIFTDYHQNNLHPWFLEPWVETITSQQQVVFTVFKQCEHMSIQEEDNLVFFINLPDDTRHPLRPTLEGGWSVELYIPPGGGDVSLYSVTTCDHKDAHGLTVEGFNRNLGRKAMTFGGLARWKTE